MPLLLIVVASLASARVQDGTAVPHGALSLGQLAERLTHLEVRCRRRERLG